MSPHRPTRLRRHKGNPSEGIDSAAVLRLPAFAPIVSVQNEAIAAHYPARLRRRKSNGKEPFAGASLLLLPPLERSTKFPRNLRNEPFHSPESLYL